MTALPATRVGAAGEYLAAAIITTLGWTATPCNADGFDLIAVQGGRTVRVQVKAAQRPATRYSYHFRASVSKPKRPMTIEDCDILCCVALDARRAFFVPVSDLAGRMTMRRPIRDIYIEGIEETTWGQAVAPLAL